MKAPRDYAERREASLRIHHMMVTLGFRCQGTHLTGMADCQRLLAAAIDLTPDDLAREIRDFARTVPVVDDPSAQEKTLREQVIEALTSEDEIAHGEAWEPVRGVGMGVCAYCDRPWPCHTQQAVDRLLRKVMDAPEDPVFDHPNLGTASVREKL